MNDQSGGFPQNGAVAPFSNAGLPSVAMRDLVVAARAKKGSQVSPSEIWRVIRKWWWLIAGIVLACLLAAIALSLLVTPEYRARTTLEINREGVQPVNMGNLQGAQSGFFQDRDFINTQAGLLRSRALAERVARSINLANNSAYVNPAMERTSRDSAATSIVAASLTVEPVRDSRLIALSVDSPSPELAQRIANSYAETFIRSSLERRFEANSYARNFLEQRLGTIRANLERSERQLVEYAQRQGIVTLNVSSASSQQGGSGGEQPLDAVSLMQLNNALQNARAARIAAEQRYRQAEANRSNMTALESPTIQELSTRRAQLQAEYQEKLGIFQPDYPQMVQLRSRIDALSAAIAQEGRNVSSSLRSEFESARAQEAQLQERVDGLTRNLLNLRERSIQYTILQRDVDTNRALYDALLQRYKEVGVAGGVGMNAVSVVDRAQIPGAPFKPNIPLNLIIGLFAGLVLGFGSAFALEWMDDTIKTPDDLTGKLQIASLGVIPAAAKGSSVQEDLSDSRSQISEAYQSVRTALQFSTEHGVPRTLLMTSTRAGEGKSSTALSVAHAAASLGASVLLIDADLRKPSFRGPSSQSDGLSNLLAGGDNLEECIHPTSSEGLFLLPAGKIPPNPAELLAAGRMSKVLDKVTKMFDYVVIDGPPVLGLADAPLLSSQCEGTLMVVEAGAIRRTAALNAVNRLRAADANIVGGILTKFNATKSGYGYGYGYGYGEDGGKYAYAEGEKPKRQIELLKSA